MMYYFALFATLLTTLTHPLAQVHRGRMRSRSETGHIAEICEPLHEHYRHQEYDDDFHNDHHHHHHHHHHRDKQFDNHYDYTEELSDKEFRELALKEALSTAMKTEHSKIRTHDHVDDILNHQKLKKLHWHTKKVGKHGQDHRESSRPTATHGNHNSNINTQHLDIGKPEKNMKNVLNAAEEHEMDMEDVSDSKASIEPALRIFEKESNRDRIDDKEHIKLNVKGRIFEDSLSRPGSKYDSPSYVDNRIHILPDEESNVNLNSNVNNVVIESKENEIGDEVLSQGNNQIDPSNSEVSEKHSSVEIDDAEVISGNQNLRQNEDSPLIQEVNTSSTSDPAEIVTPSTSPVTDGLEVYSSPDHADNKLKKTSKHLKVRGKAHGKKKTKGIHHKHHHNHNHNHEPEIPERQKNNLQQQQDLTTEKNIKTPMSMVESVKESNQPSQSTGTGNYLVDGIKSNIGDKVSSEVTIKDLKKLAKESVVNGEDIDENEASDRHKAATITSILRPSKLYDISKDSSNKEETRNDSGDKAREDEFFGNTLNHAGHNDDRSSELIKNSEGKRDPLNKSVPKHSVDVDHDDSFNESVDHNHLSDQLEKTNSLQNLPTSNSDRKDETLSSNMNSNVNSNVNDNQLTPEFRQFIHSTSMAPEFRHHKHIIDRIHDKSSEMISHHVPKSIHRNSNSNMNSNVNVVNAVDAEAGDGTAPNRRTLDPSILKNINPNYNGNVNSNSNSNRNIVGPAASRDGNRHDHHGHEMKPSKKTVKGTRREVSNLRQQLAQKERETVDDSSLDHQRR